MNVKSFLILFLAMLTSACDVESFVQANAVSSTQIENYDDARKVFWKSVYPAKANTLYCGQVFDSRERKGINVEHVFPMSWATNGVDCGTRKQCRATSQTFNKIEADMHNLYPSRSDVNQQRSSFRFGEVSGEKRKFGKQCDFEINYKARVAEPRESVRGDVARSMFYMADQYKSNGLILFEKQARLLYKWHKADPPSSSEKERNSVIERLQGNRNRFIDQPELLGQLMNNGHFF